MAILKCSVKWCEETSKKASVKNNPITFHNFPTCPELKKKWTEACRKDDEKWKPSKDSVICSKHFTEDSFKSLKTLRRLRDKSVPTLELPKKIIWEASLRDMVIADFLQEQREKNQPLDIIENIPTKMATDRNTTLKGDKRKRNSKKDAKRKNKIKRIVKD